MGLEQTLKGAAESLLKIEITKLLLIYSNNQIIIKTLKENPLITSVYIEEKQEKRVTSRFRLFNLCNSGKK